MSQKLPSSYRILKGAALSAMLGLCVTSIPFDVPSALANPSSANEAASMNDFSQLDPAILSALKNLAGKEDNQALTREDIAMCAGDLNVNQPVASLRGLDAFPGITTLSITNNQGKPIDLSGLGKKITNLQITNAKINAITALKEVPLTQLSFRDCTLQTDVLLTSMYPQDLTDLELSGMNIHDSDLKNLTSFPKLKHLNLQKNQLTQIPQVNASALIESLNISVNPIKDFSFLDKYPNVVHLSLNGIELGGQDLKTLANLNNVADLNIASCGLSKLPDSLPKSIQSLRIENNKIESIESLNTLGELKNLYASNNKITSVEGLKNTVALENLEIAHNNISDISPIKKCKEHLQQLIVHHNAISDLSFLTGFNALTSLNASNNNITNLPQTFKLGALKYLDLSGNKISSFVFLNNLPEISSLALKGCNLSDITWMVNLKNLQSVDISNNVIDSVQPLKDLEYLSDINVSHNNISDFQSIANVLTTLNAACKKINYQAPLSFDCSYNKLSKAENLPTVINTLDSLKLMLNLDNSGVTYKQLKKIENTSTIVSINNGEINEPDWFEFNLPETAFTEVHVKGKSLKLPISTPVTDLKIQPTVVKQPLCNGEYGENTFDSTTDGPQIKYDNSSHSIVYTGQQAYAAVQVEYAFHIKDEHGLQTIHKTQKVLIRYIPQTDDAESQGGGTTSQGQDNPSTLDHSNQTLNFNNLPDGEYTIRVEAKHFTEDKPSMADSGLEHMGHLTVHNGQYTLSGLFKARNDNGVYYVGVWDDYDKAKTNKGTLTTLFEKSYTPNTRIDQSPFKVALSKNMIKQGFVSLRVGAINMGEYKQNFRLILHTDTVTKVSDDTASGQGVPSLVPDSSGSTGGLGVSGSPIVGSNPSITAQEEEIPSFDQATKRIAGETAEDTMQQIVQTAFPDPVDKVVLATSESYWDALSANSLAGSLNAPVLLTHHNQLPAQTIAELKRLKTSKVVVCGGENAISNDVVSQLKALNIEVERVAGQWASDTANDIAKKLDKSDTAIVATSWGYEDALSAASFAYAKKAPIFLANYNTATLDASSIQTMKDKGVKKVYIVGGASVVSPEVEAQLQEAGITVERIAGETAYDTSAKLATKLIALGMSANNMAIATGWGYTDALAGAALCGKQNSVMVLADNTNQTAINEVVAANKHSIQNYYIFGGTSVVGDGATDVLKGVFTGKDAE